MILENAIGLSAAADASDKLTFLDIMGMGGSVMILGLLVVFFALGALVLITWLYPKISKVLISERSERTKSKSKNVKVSQAKSMKDAQPKEQVSIAQTGDDKQLAAVISAAVAASLGAKPGEIVIRSIKRVPKNTPAWGAESRMQQVFNKF